MMKFLFIPFLAGIFFLNFMFYKSGEPNSSVVEVENTVEQVHALLNIDQARENARTKISKIIDRFNPTMSTELKFTLADEIYEMSMKYPNLDIDLICATITHESARSWNPKVISHAGAIGLMQIMPNTGRWLAHVEEIPWTSAKDILFNPIYNIRLGSRYLSALIETYDLEGGLAAYNGGGKIARKWLANNKADGILWAETRRYIPRVLSLYDEFKSSSSL